MKIKQNKRTVTYKQEVFHQAAFKSSFACICKMLSPYGAKCSSYSHWICVLYLRVILLKY